jgi:hypothetical protein
MIEIIVLHCASEGVYGIDVVHQRIVLGRERFSLLKCGRSAGQRHSAMNAWQRRVLSWQHVCPRLRGHQPLHEPLEASSCSKPSRKSYCARRRCLKLLGRCRRSLWSFCRWPSCGDVRVVCHPRPRRLRWGCSRRAPVSSWHSPSRLLRLELWAWRQSYCSPAKIHRVVHLV